MKKLISVIIFFFVFSFFSFSQNPGDSIFFSSNIHTVKFYFSQAAWWDSLVAYKPLDKKMLGNVDIDGTYINSVGIQFKGNASYNKDSLKNSFKIDFNEFVSGQKYDGLKVINLNNGASDPTMMREKIFLDFCLAAGVEAPRATYELKTNETANDWTDLIHLIDKINNIPSVNFYDSLENVLSTTSWIEAWVANNIFVNLDSYMGSGHNHYLYHNTATSKFNPIIWDVNGTFGANKHMGMNISQIKNLSIFFIPSPSNSRPLNNKMLQDTVYQNLYVNTICNYVNNYFKHPYLDPLIDSLANLIRPYIYADTNKFYTNQQFEDNINVDITTGSDTIPGLKSFITKRKNSLSSQLAAYGCFLGVNEVLIYDSQLKVYPNPFSNSTTLEITNWQNQNYDLKIYDLFGREVRKSQIKNQKTEISRNNLPAGMYFYQVKDNKRFISTGKLIVQ